ncbi:NXPE family member 3-like [Trematomus bernacchii]|uniref:NXPE family member 3-like n=1 Tax=Trematomus bernacchii TaxID=40690 RepID=UPI00146ED21D|nr:NXPE family member 3-like [Trematomus bernacchii]
MSSVRVLVCGGIYNRWRLPWNNNLTIMHFFSRRQCLAFFFIVVFAFIFFALQNNKFIELRKQQVSPTSILTVTNGSKMQQGVCTFKQLPPKEAEEERLILESIAWPEIPPWPTPISIETTCDPAHSSFTILPRRGGGQWQIGDQLRVMIKMSDFKGRPKTSGGAFLLARLKNSKLQAGVVGKVVDHLNGSYSAVFSLVWEGDAVVEVTMVHSAEAIAVLQRLTREHPYRTAFKSIFRSGAVSDTTMCGVCLQPTPLPLCNFTDLRTGEPWFCFKPKKLSCETRVRHLRVDITKTRFLKPKEEELFRKSVNMKVYIKASGPAFVSVVPKKEDQPEAKSLILIPGPSGHYYKGVWKAQGSPTVRQFDDPAIRECLKAKKLHLYGDSTIRQWFEFFSQKIPGQFNLHVDVKVGPLMAVDHADNILMTYRCHAPPLSFTTVPVSELRYIANELDGLIGGADTVVVIGVWAHFGSLPIELYIRRLLSIRSAVQRLLDRAPDTVVIMRSGHPRDMTLYISQSYSDWYSMQIDRVLRSVFKGVNVHWVDAWEMVVANDLGHNIHPLTPIIKNMMDVLLTHVCPIKG